jgi:hypothetical protein
MQSGLPETFTNVPPCNSEIVNRICKCPLWRWTKKSSRHAKSFMACIERLVPFRARYDAKHILNLNTRCVAASARFISKNGNRSVGPSRLDDVKTGKICGPAGNWTNSPIDLSTNQPLYRLSYPGSVPSYVSSAEINVFREDGLPRVHIQSTVQVSNPISKQTALKWEDRR